MLNHFHERLIIIKALPYKESDLIIKGFSADHGSVTHLAKGASKSKKRFAGGVLEPLNYVELQIQPSKRPEGWGIVTEGKLIEGFEKLRTDYNRVQKAIDIIKCYDKLQLSLGEEEARKLFYLLGHTLRALSESGNLFKVEAQFFAKFLYEQGVLEPSSQGLQALVRNRYSEDFNVPDLNLIHTQLRAQIAEYLAISFG